MKTLLTLALVLAVHSFSYSQSFDKRLLERYSGQELAELEKQNPEQLELLNYALDHAVQIVDYSKEKNLDLPFVDMPDANATYISLGYEITKKNQMFRINGTEKMMVIKSTYLLNNELKNKK